MRRKSFSLALLVYCACTAPCVAAQARPASPAIRAADIDRVVARTMATFSNPGVAVGIVQDGKLTFAKGYGIRKLGEPGKVGPDTLFTIGSTTKAFTVAALAMLVDEHKLQWDDKVIDYLPQFRMYDPYVTRELTIRDLLTHRSGLGEGAGDLLFATPTDFSRQDILHALRYLKPVSGFRSEFAYNNLMYVVAGELVPAVSGQSWEDFVETRILHRLGMEPCAVNRARVKNPSDIATPHATVEGVLKAIADDDLTLVGPAGAIECNITGMAKWVQTLLAEGTTAATEPLFSKAQSLEMWSAQTLIAVAPDNLLGSNFKAYGLGWGLEDFHGYKLVQHSGSTSGITSLLALVPELNLGVIVLVNHQDSAPSIAITLQILDAYLGPPQRDWIATLKAATDRNQQAARDIEADVAKVIAAEPIDPPLPLQAYAGVYHDAWRSDATVRVEGGKLILKFSHTDALEGALQPYSGNVFVVRWNDRTLNADAYVRFAQGYGSTVEGMTLQAISPTTDFSFDFQDLDFSKTP